MNSLKDALIYAVVNGVTGFSIYTGSALYFGSEIQPALVAGLGIGMVAFGSYMVKESEEVNMDFKDKLEINNKKNVTQKVNRAVTWITPSSVRRHGLFHFFR